MNEGKRNNSFTFDHHKNNEKAVYIYMNETRLPCRRLIPLI
jgi:hypothetical protein